MPFDSGTFLLSIDAAALLPDDESKVRQHRLLTTRRL
jgi:hypothetical protein